MKEPSVKVNFIYNTIYRVLGVMIPLITAPYASRVFGAEGVGINSYVASIAIYFTLFASLGSLTYGQREIAMHRNERQKVSMIFWEIEALIFIATIICLFVWAILIILTKQYQIYFLIQTMTIVSVIFNISWLYSGLEQFKVIVVRNSVIQIIGILFLFIYIKKPEDLPLYMLVSVAANLLGYLSMWSLLKQYVDLIPLKKLRPFRHFKGVVEYFIPTIASSVYQYLDKIMLGLMTFDTIENGYYEQTTKIVNMMLGVTISLDVVMESRMSFLFAEGKDDEIKERLQRSMEFTLFISIPITFGICGIAGGFVPWFFGPGYEKVILLLVIYSIIVIFTSINCCLGGQYLTPCGYRNKSTKALIVGSVVNLVLNAILIPYCQSLGATIATLACETVITFLYVHLSKGFMSWSIILRKAAKKLVAATIMLLVVLAIGYGREGNIVLTLIQVLVGVIIYGSLLFVQRDVFAGYCLDFLKHKVREVN